MQTPKLTIRKGMVSGSGRPRPAIQFFAVVDPAIRARLEEHYLTENLFKRAAYAQGYPEGIPTPSPSLAPHLGSLVKNDACPEITVKTILNGQVFQGQTLWEMKAFEYIACRAFDSLIDLIATVVEMERQTFYVTAEAQALADRVAFDADTAAEAAAAAAAASAVATSGDLDVAAA